MIHTEWHKLFHFPCRIKQLVFITALLIRPSRFVIVMVNPAAIVFSPSTNSTYIFDYSSVDTSTSSTASLAFHPAAAV